MQMQSCPRSTGPTDLKTWTWPLKSLAYKGHATEPRRGAGQNLQLGLRATRCNSVCNRKNKESDKQEKRQRREREREREREIKIRGSREEQNDQLTIRLSIGVGWFSNDATLSRTWSEILAFIIFNSSWTWSSRQSRVVGKLHGNKFRRKVVAELY